MRSLLLSGLLPLAVFAAAGGGSGNGGNKAKASDADPVATGNEPPEAKPEATQLTNATARTPMEDRTAAAQTRPLEEDEDTGDAPAQRGGPDINGDRLPAAENLPGAQGSKTPPPEGMPGDATGATSGGRAPSVEADMTTVRVKIDRASTDPVRLYVHGVGRWNDLRVGQEYDLPEDAVVALENSGAGVTRIESENQARAAKARSGRRD